MSVLIRNRSRPVRDEKVIAAVKSAVRGAKGKAGGPVAVEKSARPESSPLHKFFEWDNTKAAYAHRLAQARGLIQAVVGLALQGKAGKAGQGKATRGAAGNQQRRATE